MPAVTTHTVTIYRRAGGGVSAYREKASGWSEVASGVACDLQPATGTVDQRTFGREARRRRKGFFPTGTDLQPDDGVVVTSGPGPSRYLVVEADDWGTPGDVEAVLEETTEKIP